MRKVIFNMAPQAKQAYFCPKCNKYRESNKASTQRKPIQKPCAPCATTYNRMAGRLATFRRNALRSSAPLSKDHRYLTMRDWEEITKRSTRCAKCSKACTEFYPSAIVPFEIGGPLRRENTKAVCATCKNKYL